MQILRTNRAQAMETARSEGVEAPAPSPVDGEAVEGFFDQEFFTGQEQPVLPASPFDALFSGAQPPPGTEALHGLPSVEQFAPVNVVTLDQWLMGNPDGRFYIHLYKEKMESILQNRYQPRLSQFRELLANGGMQPQEVRAIQEMIELLEEGILKMNQEIEKAAAKIQTQNEIWLRERYEMKDLDGDGFIRDESGEILYAIGKLANGDPVILQRDGEDKWKPAVNPYIDPEYMPALFNTENLSLIDPSLHDDLAGSWSYDEAFELNNVQQWLQGGFTDSTFGNQIDLAMPEGVWVEVGDNGKPKEVNDPETGFHKFIPKPFEQVESEELGTEPRWGQKPPETDEEREKWVFVKVTDLKVKSEPVGSLNGREIDGGYVHFIFEDREGNTIMRIRVQGVSTSSASPLTSDGSNYIAATTVGVAVNGGLIKNDAGEDAYTDHSSRVSYLNLDATGLYMTGKVLPANVFDPQSVANFYEELGIPAETDANGNFSGFNPSANANSDPSDTENFRTRAIRAANDTLMRGFLNPYGYVDIPDEETDPGWTAQDNEIMAGRFGMTNPHYGSVNPNRTLTSMAAYVPRNLRDENEGIASGIAVTGIRGVIKGTDKGNDIIVVQGPNEEALRKMLPFAAAITPDEPAYGTFVDAGVGKNIVVSKGGDIYARGATFFWREEGEEIRGDQIHLDLSGVNTINNNNKVFVHIGDSDPELVQIANGDDIGEDPMSGMDEDEVEALDVNGDDRPDPELALDSAKDDWFELPNPEIADFSNLAGDGGRLETHTVETSVVIQSIDTASDRIDVDVIHYDFETDTSASRSAEEWGFSPMAEIEDENWDAFFVEWESFMDQETGDDMSLEGMQNE